MAIQTDITNTSETKVRRKRSPKGAPERFLRAHINHNSNECVVWPFAMDFYGYGIIGCRQSHFPAKRAHRLICMWAHGYPPFQKAEAAHSCGNRACVNPNHLRWASTLENNRERRAHGTMPMGEMVRTAKITAAEARTIYADPRRQIEIAKDYGVWQTVISKIKSGRTWAHVTGHTSNNPKKRLDPDTVRAIRACIGSNPEIARQYCTSVTTVKRIRRGEAWKFIDG